MAAETIPDYATATDLDSLTAALVHHTHAARQARADMHSHAAARRDAIRALHDRGMSYARIGDLVGISKSAICQLALGGDEDA